MSQVGFGIRYRMMHDAHECGVPGTPAMSGGPAAFRAPQRHALGGMVVLPGIPGPCDLFGSARPGYLSSRSWIWSRYGSTRLARCRASRAVLWHRQGPATVCRNSAGAARSPGRRAFRSRPIGEFRPGTAVKNRKTPSTRAQLNFWPPARHVP